MSTCDECGQDYARTQLAGEHVCAPWAEDYADLRNEFALDHIARLMDGKEWDADTADAIAGILRETGRRVRDVIDATFGPPEPGDDDYEPYDPAKNAEALAALARAREEGGL